ncbi:AP2-like ethylene-responsive transcription factor [Iris pallida]|uniref:AP2-like ethylene-responsive transcription factor n=1 Tax=Iris pallida TaxID=29817 RepID=A0AAX6E160_IRIPA|nr:AP2-like ethylene-responsive transcription factor [Iris pallida]
MSGSERHRSSDRSDLRLLLGVMGASLAPVHVSAGEPLPHLSIKDTPIMSIFWKFCNKASPFLLFSF